MSPPLPGVAGGLLQLPGMKALPSCVPRCSMVVVPNPLLSLSLPHPTCTQMWQHSRLPSPDESVEIYFCRWEIFHLDKTTAMFPVSVHKRNNRQMCIEWIYLHRILPYKEQWKLKSVWLPNHSRVFGFFFLSFFLENIVHRGVP